MLYIFLVDTGKMMTFDMKLALEPTSKLKRVIEDCCDIPASKQVLLISGGDLLESDIKVCSYSAGTDTNPIFLFCKANLETGTPPTPNIDYTTEQNLEEKVEGCLNLPPSLTTVASRAQLAQYFLELAHKEYKNCGRLVHEQHLQHQGWAAVVANLEEVVITFKVQKQNFVVHYEKFLESREEKMNLLENFNDCIRDLSTISVVPSLLKDGREVTLQQWMKLNQDESIHDTAVRCKTALTQLNAGVLEKIEEEASRILETLECEGSEYKEIKGIEQRLSMLEDLMRQAKECVKQQTDMAKAFQANQSRATRLNDPSILPDLCESHRSQLQVMLTNHTSLVNLRQRITKGKVELCHGIYRRLQWIMHIEKMMADLSGRLFMYNESLRRIQRFMDELRQIDSAPQLYARCLQEVVRRRKYRDAFTKWASELSSVTNNLHVTEVEKRDAFNNELESHFLRRLFSSLNEYPPPIAINPPQSFDEDLPDIKEDDVICDRGSLTLPYVRLKTISLDSKETEKDEVVPYHHLYQQIIQQDDYSIQEESMSESRRMIKLEDLLLSLFSDEASSQWPRDFCDIVKSAYDIPPRLRALHKAIIRHTSLCNYEIAEALSLHAIRDLEALLGRNHLYVATSLNLLAFLYTKQNKHAQAVQLITDALTIRVNILGEHHPAVAATLTNLASLHRNLENHEEAETLMKQAVDIQLKFANDQKEVRERMKSCINEIKQTHESLKIDVCSKLNQHLQMLKEASQYLIQVLQQVGEHLSTENRQQIKLLRETLEIEQAKHEDTAKQLYLEQEHLTRIQLQQDSDDLIHTLQREMKEKLEEISMLKTEKSNLPTLINEEVNKIKQQLEQEYNQRIIQAVNLERKVWEEQHEAELKSQKEQLAKEYKSEIDSIRARFRLMSTASQERLSSAESLDSSSPRNEGGLLASLRDALDKEKREHADAIILERQYWQNTLQKIKEEHLFEKTRLEGERQSWFNGALQQLKQDKDKVIQDLKKQLNKLSQDDICVSGEAASPVEMQRSFAVCKGSDSVDTGFSGGSPETIRKQTQEKQQKLNQLLRTCEVPESICALLKSGVISSSRIRCRDKTLLLWDPDFGCYVGYDEGTKICFLNRDCYAQLGLNTDVPDVLYVTAEITHKEFCRTRKMDNRFRLPKDTTFYRIRCKLWNPENA